MFGKIFAKLFPIWAVLGAFLGYAYPDVFVPARGLIVPMLMLVMLSMGLTLTARNFVEVASYKWALLLGVFLQFTVMPLTALLLSHTLDLNSDLLIGMLLVGSVAGGTASNVMTYLARGHLALSVSMTAFSTLASVALTPLLLTLYLGTSVSVPAYDMLLSLIKIIVIPISIGVLLNTV